MVREAVCLEVFPVENRPPVGMSGGRPGNATRAARALVDDGCEALVSFGVCGGLDPALGPGTIVLANGVVTGGEASYAVDDAWRRALHDAVSGYCDCVAAPVLGSTQIVAGPRAKQELFHRTGAAIVDMESHEVAAVAAEFGIPFLVIRAVADSARRRVPSAASCAISEDGATDIAALIGALLVRPWQLPGLIRLGRDSYAAQSALRRVAALTTSRFSLG